MARPCANSLPNHLRNKKHQILLIGDFVFISRLCLAVFLSQNHCGICREFGDSSVQS